MKFEDILTQVREKFSKTDTSTIPDTLAIQFNLTGDGGGTFYAEVKNGILTIEPYEYIDRDVALTMSVHDFMQMFHQKLDPVAAYTIGKLHVDGDIGKALEINRFLQ